MTAEYIIKIKGTKLWMYERTIYSTYSAGHDTSYSWVLSPLTASRYETVKSANTAAGKGMPKGHWSIHRLLGDTEAVHQFLTEEVEPETKPVTVKIEVVEAQRSCFKRWFCGDA